MKMKQLIPAMLVFVSGVTLAAIPSFEDLDINGDGALSTQEVNGVLRHFNFIQADKNQDGTLDKEEYELGLQEQNQDQMQG